MEIRMIVDGKLDIVKYEVAEALAEMRAQGVTVGPAVIRHGPEYNIRVEVVAPREPRPKAAPAVKATVKKAAKK
jgi:hypothetical protein